MTGEQADFDDEPGRKPRAWLLVLVLLVVFVFVIVPVLAIALFILALEFSNM